MKCTFGENPFCGSMESFLWISFGVLMESLLWEHLIGVDLLSMIEYLFWRSEREEDLMDASKFQQYQRSCLMCCEFSGNYWYGFYDMVQFGWFGLWSDQYTCDLIVTWLLWYTSCLYMLEIEFILIYCGEWERYWIYWNCCDCPVVSLDSGS